MADGTIIIDVEFNEQAFRESLENMGETLKSNAELMIKSIDGVSESFVLLPGTMGSVTDSAADIINGIINNITEKNPVMTRAGTDFFMAMTADFPAFAKNITNAAQAIINQAAEILSAAGPPLMEKAGFELFGSILNPLPDVLKDIAKAPQAIIALLYLEFDKLTAQFKTVGENIVRGIWLGISSMAGWLAGSVTAFFSGIIKTATDFLGISSPSKLFRDLVGKNIALGVLDGIESEMPGVIENTKAQMARLSGIAAQSSRFELNHGAADIFAWPDALAAPDIRGLLKDRLAAANAAPVMPEIILTLEPSGDLRGFFEYISMGVKRADYLNGEVI